MAWLFTPLPRGESRRRARRSQCMLSARPESMLQHHTQTLSVTYDVIVVLGAAVWPGGQPSPTLQRRVMHAVDLMQQGYAVYLLVTGGMGHYPPTEAEVMQRLAVAHGI